MSGGFDRATYFELIRVAGELRGAEAPAKDPLADLFCKAHPNMGNELAAFSEMPASSSTARVARGHALEAIVALAFAGLGGVRELKSFAAAGAQYDLLVGGAVLDPAWACVRNFLDLPADRDDVLVEVKATEGPITSQQVLRLCALISGPFAPSVGLGVLVCPSGATGHPTPGRRAPSLRQARLHQVLYEAKTGTPIVVLDQSDMDAFAVAGGLLRRLSFRRRELQQLHGLSEPIMEGPIEVDLPSHMTAAAEWLRAKR